ncbi:helix-turn-helix transcriptional regulator [Nocardiopsis sp. EMB25]|uniref:helix-turn-helix domain-containing protein n=1 Tax=Nocardiopsis sp. EMB25 TaxID=2835867 RepID=UPI002283D94D|nr:helix-turn-helix transcriptional regulator [Nocardiopsis sp. EMB25]MCY9786221.1 helix-turn-helix transcriptional regulator [Nocardiopsis sp. EMB25]
MDEPQKPEWVRFGQRVKRLRRRQGLSLNELARRTDWSASYLGKIENATRAPNGDVVTALDRALRTNGALLREWGDVLKARTEPEWYRQSRDYEKRAREIRFFHPLVVPGFFQTSEYARLLISQSVPGASEDHIQNVIRTRASWRADLRTDAGLALNVILAETALSLPMPAEVMGEQIERLVQESERANITVQILPAGVPDLAWINGPFRLIYIGDEQAVLCVEHPVGELLFADTREIRNLEAVFGRLQAWALPPDSSARKLKEMRQAL